MSTVVQSPGALWKRPKVQAETGLGKTKLYELIKAGQFPKPVALGVRSRAWRAQEVQSWVDALPKAE